MTTTTKMPLRALNSSNRRMRRRGISTPVNELGAQPVLPLYVIAIEQVPLPEGREIIHGPEGAAQVLRELLAPKDRECFACHAFRRPTQAHLGRNRLSRYSWRKPRPPSRGVQGGVPSKRCSDNLRSQPPIKRPHTIKRGLQNVLAVEGSRRVLGSQGSRLSRGRTVRLSVLDRWRAKLTSGASEIKRR